MEIKRALISSPVAWAKHLSTFGHGDDGGTQPPSYPCFVVSIEVDNDPYPNTVYHEFVTAMDHLVGLTPADIFRVYISDSISDMRQVTFHVPDMVGDPINVKAYRGVDPAEMVGRKLIGGIKSLADYIRDKLDISVAEKTSLLAQIQQYLPPPPPPKPQPQQAPPKDS